MLNYFRFKMAISSGFCATPYYLLQPVFVVEMSIEIGKEAGRRAVLQGRTAPHRHGAGLRGRSVETGGARVPHLVREEPREGGPSVGVGGQNCTHLILLSSNNVVSNILLYKWIQNRNLPRVMSISSRSTHLGTSWPSMPKSSPSKCL